MSNSPTPVAKPPTDWGSVPLSQFSPQIQPIESLQTHTVQELARLGNVSEKTILRRIRDGRLKAIRLGKGWRIGHSESVKFLTQPT